MVQVVVQIGEDLAVASADLRREGEQDQVGVVPVESERLSQVIETRVGRVTVRCACGDRVIQTVRSDRVVDLPVRTQQRIHLVVRDDRAPKLSLGSHCGASALSADRAQQQEVGSAQTPRDIAEVGRVAHGT